MRAISRSFRWACLAVPCLAVATLIGIPSLVWAIGAEPQITGNLQALLFVAALLSSYAIVCVLLWVPVARWLPWADRTWKAFLPSFMLLIVVVGQLTAIVLYPQDYSAGYCAIASGYVAMAVLLPRLFDRSLIPGCFESHAS